MYGQDVAHVLVLVVVRVDVDDQHVVELALHRLLPRMREQPRGVEFVDGDAPAAIRDQVHDRFPLIGAKAFESAAFGIGTILSQAGRVVLPRHGCQPRKRLASLPLA